MYIDVRLRTLEMAHTLVRQHTLTTEHLSHARNVPYGGGKTFRQLEQ